MRFDDYVGRLLSYLDDNPKTAGLEVKFNGERDEYYEPVGGWSAPRVEEDEVVIDVEDT